MMLDSEIYLRIDFLMFLDFIIKIKQQSLEQKYLQLFRIKL
jgi:hypothetical protein